MNILSIDAWRDDCGWSWNAWYKVGTTESDTINLDSSRDVLRYMRERGFLSDYSKGRVAIEDDEYNIVIMDKGTREPLFAIEYGSEQEQ